MVKGDVMLDALAKHRVSLSCYIWYGNNDWRYVGDVQEYQRYDLDADYLRLLDSREQSIMSRFLRNSRCLKQLAAQYFPTCRDNHAFIEQHRPATDEAVMEWILRSDKHFRIEQAKLSPRDQPARNKDGNLVHRPFSHTFAEFRVIQYTTHSVTCRIERFGRCPGGKPVVVEAVADLPAKTVAHGQKLVEEEEMEHNKPKPQFFGTQPLAGIEREVLYKFKVNLERRGREVIKQETELKHEQGKARLAMARLAEEVRKLNEEKENLEQQKERVREELE